MDGDTLHDECCWDGLSPPSSSSLSGTLSRVATDARTHSMPSKPCPPKYRSLLSTPCGEKTGWRYRCRECVCLQMWQRGTIYGLCVFTHKETRCHKRNSNSASCRWLNSHVPSVFVGVFWRILDNSHLPNLARMKFRRGRGSLSHDNASSTSDIPTIVQFNEL